MKHIRIMGLAFFAVVALSAATAGAASATTPSLPVWTVGASLALLAELTRLNLASTTTNSPQVFQSSVVWIKCEKVSISNGWIENDMLPEGPGLDGATVTFKECTTGKVEKGKLLASVKCNVSAGAGGANEVELSLKSQLVYNGTAEQAEKLEGPVGDLFTPASGTTFVSVNFTEAGEKCPVAGPLVVTGSIVASVSPGAGGMAKVGTLTFPSANSGKQKWYTMGGVATTASLKVSLETPTQTGKVEVELENGEEFGVQV